MRLPIALAAALVAMPGLAQAERLASSPVLALDVTTVNCPIQYIGFSAKPIAVRVTIKEGPSVLRQDNAARLSRSTPSYSTAATCSRGNSATCDNAICIFNFNGPKADFRASICVVRGDGENNGGQLCLPAY